MNGYHIIKKSSGDIIKRNLPYSQAIGYCNQQDHDGCYGNGETPSMRRINRFIVWSPSAGREV